MNKKNKQFGFTLVEVVIAGVVFGIATVGLFSVLSSSRVSSDASKRELQAAYLGKELLEELRAKVDQRPGSWPLTCDGGLHNWPAGGLPAHPIVDDFGGWVEYRCPVSGAAGYREVQLQVMWNEP